MKKKNNMFTKENIRRVVKILLEKFHNVKVSTSIKPTTFLSLLVIILFSSTCTLAFENNDLKKQLTESKNQYNELADTYTRLFDGGANLYLEHQSLKTKYNKDSNAYKKLNAEVKDLVDTIDKLDEQNKELSKENKQMHDDLNKYEKRSELFNKYEYAVYNGKKRTSFTYSQLKLAEDIMKEKGIDTNLLLAIAMTESGGNETASNSGSTARGYGQFLRGTGKFVYEDLMNAGTYDHNYALNGYTNIKLMANYLNYLKLNNTSVYGIIESYRGKKNCTSYMAKIHSYLKKGGTSLEKINNQLY